MKIFEHQIKVNQSEIDELNHVNNVVYLKWINHVSGLHWKILSNNEINNNYFWIVSKHEINYLKPAFLDDKITLKTWIVTLEGVSSKRKVEIYKNDDLIAKSITTWILINVKTQKIARIPEEIKAIFDNVI